MSFGLDKLQSTLTRPLMIMDITCSDAKRVYATTEGLTIPKWINAQQDDVTIVASGWGNWLKTHYQTAW